MQQLQQHASAAALLILSGQRFDLRHRSEEDWQLFPATGCETIVHSSGSAYPLVFVLVSILNMHLICFRLF